MDSKRLLCSQKAGVKCSYISFLVQKRFPMSNKIILKFNDYNLVPPGRPTIIDGATERPANRKIGPYRIGDNVTLTCLVIGNI